MMDSEALELGTSTILWGVVLGKDVFYNICNNPAGEQWSSQDKKVLRMRSK